MPAPLDMSLRFWSDDIALAPIISHVGPSDVAHVRGEFVPLIKGATPRKALRHYASVAHEQAWLSSDVDAWMRLLLARIENDRVLASLLKTHQLDGTFWIAVLGEQLVPAPNIDPHLVQDAASLGLTIFLENYTDLENGNPSRRWLAQKSTSVSGVGSSRA